MATSASNTGIATTRERTALSHSTQASNPSNKTSNKINLWSKASSIFLIVGIAAISIGTLGYFNIFIATSLITSKIVLASGLTSLALSILMRVFKKDSSAKEESSESSKSESSKASDTTAETEYTISPVQNKFLSSVQLNIIDGIESFIKEGADVDKTDRDGNTPLQIAVQNGYLRIIEILIENGADVEKDLSATPLMKAVDHENIEAIKILIEKGKANINGRDLYGKTALMRAIDLHNPKIEAIQTLIECGADINITDSYKNTPLLKATQLGHAEIVEILINAKANVNYQGTDGITALFLAVDTYGKKCSEEDSKKIIKALIKAGADKTLRNTDGTTAFSLAKKKEIILL